MKIISQAITGISMGANVIGAPSFSKVNPYGLYDNFNSDAYASLYPSISAISKEYMGIRPYAIDNNGKKVDNNNIINALFHPNQLDSSVSFQEKIAVSTLVLPKTYLLVWRREGIETKPGGDFGFKGAKIAGFTFLERPAITVRDGKTFYSMGSQEFTDQEVIVLPGGVDPHHLYGGYSPAISAKRWATLDDYIADFQKGFFENGAVPAGQMIITSVTQTDFEDTKKTLQEKHRGVSNNNNIVYVPRPVGQDGKPADAKIEWIPFAQSNKDIDFKNLFEQTNKRLDLAFGVPQIVKGVDDAATYANAQVASQGFSRRAVYPLALRNYTQITHELNRITGGMGIAITFEYEIPLVADEEKVSAETKNLEAQLLTTMTDAGYTLESVINAFELSNAYKLLKSGTDGTTVIDNDKPEVDDGDEVVDSPNPEKIDGVTPVNKFKEGGIVENTDFLVTGEANSQNPKAELTDLAKLEKAARKFMQTQVDRAIEETEPTDEFVAEPTEDERQVFIDEMMATITGILLAEGEITYADGIELLNKSDIITDNLQGFSLDEATSDGYRAYLRRVGDSYGKDTADSIRSVLLNADAEGLSRSEIEKNLKNIMNTDDWRVKRLGLTELNRSQGIGSVEGMREIQNETGVEIEKSLNHPQGAQCEFCKALEGQWVKVEQPYISLGESVVGTDGGILVNDFVANEGYDPHPNGKGTMIYRVVR